MTTENLIEFTSDRPGRVAEAQLSIEAVWRDLRSDPTLGPGLPAECPFHAGPGGAQFGVAETILISVAAGLMKDAVKTAWTDHLQPYLLKKYGRTDSVEENDGAG